MEEIPGQTLGRFEVRGELGRGGMGVVLRAFDPRLQREVAVKTLTEGPHVSKELLARFCREAQATARLQHTGIMVVHEVGEEGDLHFIVMDLIKGKTLDAHLKDGLALPEAVGLLHQVAVALHHAHGHGVVHRDVKPGNIMVTGDGRAVIMDFGLARDLNDGSDLTSTGQTLGTPLYMAPEQVDSKYGAVSPATDVYALGAVLYRAACGQPPFNAYSAMILFKQILMDAPKPLRQVNPQVPAPLEAVVMRCLAKQPSQRYASAAALADDLQNFLAKRPISAPPPSRKRGTTSRRLTGMRSTRPTTSQRPLIAAGVTAALALLTAFAAWFATGYDPSPPPETSNVAVVALSFAIRIVEPVHGLVTDQPEVTVEGELQTGQADIIWVGGVPLTVKEGVFSGQVSLPRGASGYTDGAYPLAFATSRGAEPLAQVTVILDTSEPALEITAPTSGAVVGGDEIEVQGSVRDANLETLTRESGEEVAVADDGSFSLQQSLPQRDGRFEVILVASDKAGNRGEAVTWVLVDRQPPRVLLSEPQQGAIISTTTVLLSGHVKDARPKGLWIDGRPVDLLEQDRFEAHVTLETEGDQTILLEAEDENGQRSEPVTLHLTVDTTPPQLVLQLPESALLTSATQIALRGRVSDAHPPAHVWADERELALDPEGHFMVELSLTEGTNPIELRCVDQAGNPARIQRTVIRDTTPAELRLDPELPPYQSGGSKRFLVVAGTVAEAGVSVTVNGESLATTHRAFETTVKLQPGDNPIEVVVTDRAGNVTRETASVRYFRRKLKLPPDTWWKPTKAHITYAKESGKPLWLEPKGALGTRFVLIPPGTFLMGSPLDASPRQPNEVPHRVTLNEGYYLAATEVTNAQYRQYSRGYGDKDTGEELSTGGDDQPALWTSWHGAAKFCDWLTENSPDNETYRLPTEAEWEHACRAGTTSVYFWGDDATQAFKYANGEDRVQNPNSEGSQFPGDDGHQVTAAVGSYQPNPWGLFDMLGNAWEWCHDVYVDELSENAQDPQGPADGKYRVARGGGHTNGPRHCHSASRYTGIPEKNAFGFRVVLEVTAKPNR